MTKSHQLYCFASALIMLSLSAQHTHAQTKYPERPIRIVVPFSPGGGTDIMGRKLSASYTAVLGQQVIVDNKAGAGGTIGSAEVARAKPDGYTLLIATSSTHTTAPLTIDNLPYDPVKNFSSIATLGFGPYLIAVHPNVAQTIPDLIKRVKSQPGKYSFGSTGVGGMVHFTGELFKKQAGNLDIAHVPYKGTGQSIQDLIAGHIPIVITAVSSALPHHRSGRVRILAIFNERRSKAAPDIPTAVELGMKGMLAYTINVLCAPADTPKAVIDQLFRTTVQVMDEPFQKDLVNLGIEPAPDTSPEKATQLIREEIAKWAPIVKATDMAK
jgi:tripartite-type tricarboxylate transporter receptor subunit TctC